MPPKRKYFRRTLVAPLYAPVFELSKIDPAASGIGADAKGSLAEAVSAAKARGNACFRRGSVAKASAHYRQAVNYFYSGDYSAELRLRKTQIEVPR